MAMKGIDEIHLISEKRDLFLTMKVTDLIGTPDVNFEFELSGTSLHDNSKN